MGKAKEIIVKVIPAKIANEFIKKHHYSGKVVQNSQLHLGAFLNNVLHGVMQFGPSLDKRKIQGLVKGTNWNEFIELNRLAFDDFLPKNSESRCIAIAIKLLRKNAPQIKWIISFADATQCGDGTIYRASGFILTGIKKNEQIWKLPSGYIFNDTSIRPGIGTAKQWNEVVKKLELDGVINIKQNGASSMKQFLKAGAIPMIGYQLRYIYFIDKSKQKDLTVSILPFSKIDELNAGMYKGQKITYKERNASEA